MIFLARKFASRTTRPLFTAIAVALACTIPTAAFAAPRATPSAKPAGPSPEFNEAVHALRAIKTMKADFTQTNRDGKVLTGELTLKRPGRIRFQYAKGTDLLIVSNGHALTLVDYSVKQVQRWPIKNSPLGALLSPGRDVARYGKLVPTGTPNVVAISVEDPKRPEYGQITLFLVRDPSAPGGLELVSWVALDSQNVRTTVRLSHQRYGMPVPDSTFRFRDPRKTSHRAG